MILYSTALNTYSKHFLIMHLRKNKWFWDNKFFFEHLSKIHYLKLAKSLLIRSHKIVFVQMEGVDHHWYYNRPTYLADIVFGYRGGPKNIYWNYLFDDYASGRTFNPAFKTKSTTDLIPKVCFISSNTNKIRSIKNNYHDLYKDLDIYGEFHKPIDKERNLNPARCEASFSTTERYMASLCIENNDDEGYAQGSALWSLSVMTPPILKASPVMKNFFRPEFYINFFEYINMTNQQRLSAIKKVQERLLLGDNYLTNLTQDYINFFSESFAGDEEPDIKKISLQSQSYRKKFIKI